MPGWAPSLRLSEAKSNMFQTKVPQMYGRTANCFQDDSCSSDWYSSGCHCPPACGWAGLSACWVTFAPAPYSDSAILWAGSAAWRLSAQPPRLLEDPSYQPKYLLYPVVS